MEEKTYMDRMLDFAWTYGPKILMAAVILLAGLWLIRRISRTLNAFMQSRGVDNSLRPFFGSLMDIAMKVVLLLVVGSMIGIETTSFIAIFSAVAFSIGLALQGSLGNFASGVLILLFRPFKVGDMIRVEESMGVVSAIQIFSTLLITPQGKRIIIPNGKLTEHAVECIGDDVEVRADIIVHVKDFTPIPVLRAAAWEAVGACPQQLPDRKPFVEIAGFPRDAMKVEIGCWTTGRFYWDTYYFLHESTKTALDKYQIQLAEEDKDD